ncbi:MAG: ABC transporter ATP-binding protein [Planctomycetes bacterium]|nr:ABC transporter ATP-binding protein [Planctomycetota bacterium]
MQQSHTIPSNEPADAVSPGDGANDQLIATIESYLAGPAPIKNGPSAETMAQWLDEIAGGENWPQKSAETGHDSLTWAAARTLLRDLVTQQRAANSINSGISATQNAAVRSCIRRLAAFSAIAALNSPASSESDATSGPRYSIDDGDKHSALTRFLNGWQPADAGAATPSFEDLMLGENDCPTGSLGGRSFYYEILDCILENASDPNRIPPVLRPYLTEPVIVARDAWVRFFIRFHRREATVREGFARLFGAARKSNASGAQREFWALRGIDFAAYPGDAVGVIGRNGSGKTTLLKSLAGILSPDRGTIVVTGKVGCLLSFGVGFNAHLSGRENVFLNGSILGLSEREINRRLNDIIAFSELGEFIDAPVRTYSAGMRGRLGFSIAVNIDPDVLILDEVLTVGDDYFQKKAGSILDRFHRANKTVVIASHSMDLIRRVSTRAIWIDQGRIRLSGDPTEVTRAYVADCRKQREAAGIKESDTDASAAPSSRDAEISA